MIRKSALRLMQMAVVVAAIVMFLFALTITTDWQYSKTSDGYNLRPENIISGSSWAPNQYRILAPLLCDLLRSTGIVDWDRSDRVVIFGSILLCYAVSGVLFYVSARSLPLTMIALIAVLGSFIFGMSWKYRQEFFEVAFVSLALVILISGRLSRWRCLALAAITVLGTLNRETFIFCITGIIAHTAWRQYAVRKNGSIVRSAIPLAGLLLIYAAIFVGVRSYYGVTQYHGAFWRSAHNFSNIRTLGVPLNAIYMGAGILFAYIATVALGNREYLAFILGYAIPLFFVAYMISNFYEHRIFYPLMVLLIASILSFAKKQWMVLDHSIRPTPS